MPVDRPRWNSGAPTTRRPVDPTIVAVNELRDCGAWSALSSAQPTRTSTLRNQWPAWNLRNGSQPQWRHTLFWKMMRNTINPGSRNPILRLIHYHATLPSFINLRHFGGVLFSPPFVCLFVCLLAGLAGKCYGRIFVKLGEEVDYGPEKIWSNNLKWSGTHILDILYRIYRESSSRLNETYD